MTESISTRHRGRKLAGVLAGALALGIVPFAFPASSQTDAEPDLRDITINACPVDEDGSTEVPEDGFTDMAQGADFEFEVDCVAWYDVTSGATETTYNPFGTVSRGQMATFIANLVEYADPGALAAEDDDTDAFPCVSDPDEFADDTHLANVQLLADADIVLGGPAGLPLDCYGPTLRVTRAQMASFIAQAQVFLGQEITPPSTTTTTVADTTTTTVDGTTTTTVDGTTTTTVATGPVFANYFDDDDDSVHENNINAIASEGIVVGTSDRTYSPQADIRRQQMAAFLARKLDYLIENGVTSTPDPVVTTTTTAPGATTTTSTPEVTTTTT